jgi:hypothetical protein
LDADYIKQVTGIFIEIYCNPMAGQGRQRGQILKTNAMNDNEVIIPVLGILMPIIITLGAFVMLTYVRKFENLERMAIIDKGLNPDLFKKERSTSGALRASLLLVGGGIGLLMGYWLDELFRMEEVAYFSMILLFGGAGLGLAYLIEEKKNKQANNS